jgi:ABC-type phosphate/phosphonate transport system substrate-binding protein
LGAVLYALLTGQPPFQGPTPLDVFKQIVEQTPTRPRSLNPSVHPNLETICLKCLEKEPLHRYSTAEMLAEDLDSFAAGRSIKARRASPIHRTQRWIKRNPVGTALIASLCLGLSAALALLKIVNDQRQAVELDRDEAFDEGMQKISQIWRDPHTKSVTISARELAILAGCSPAGLARARQQLTLGVSANDGPSSMAQRYARLLGGFQEQMERELGEKVAFHLRLLKRFNQNEETLARGEVDFIVLSSVDFLQAERVAPGVVLIAWANTSREGVIFTRTNSGAQRLADLRGKSLALPDPDLSLTVWAKAQLFAAGLRANDLRSCTNIVDQGLESGQAVLSTAETINRVLRGEADAAATHRTQFERYRHLGLAPLDQFPETPNVLAARAGLGPTLLNALRNVIASPPGNGSWPDSKFVADAPVERGSQGASVLEALRTAMQHAEAFDKPVAP